MSGAAPWSVKGIDPKVREAARDAARRQGLTLGEYLNQALAAHEATKHLGDEPLLQQRPRGLPRPSSFYDDAEDFGEGWNTTSLRAANPRLADPMARLAQKLEAIERRTQLAITGLDRTVSTIDRSMLGLAQRVDDAEAGANDAADKVVEALEQFRAAHDSLTSKLRDAEEQVSESRHALEHANANLDDVRIGLERRLDAAERSAHEADEAAATLTARIAASDEALARKIGDIEALSRTAIHAAIAEVRSAGEEAARTAAEMAAAALNDVRAQQEMIGQRLASTEQAARQHAHDALHEARAAREELTDRMERLEDETRASHGGGEFLGDLRAAQEVLARRLTECESGIRAVSDGAMEEMRRIQTALIARIEHAQAQSHAQATPASSAAVDEVRATQALLTQRLAKAEQETRDQLAGLRQAAGGAIADLRNAQLRLTQRIKDIEDRPIGEVSGDLSTFMDMRNAQQSLETRLQALEARPATTSAPASSNNFALDTIKSDQSELAARLNDIEARMFESEERVKVDAGEWRLAARTIEDSVQRLQERIAQAETTANAVIQKLEETSVAAGGHDEPATEALRALFERRLGDMEQSNAAAIEDARVALTAQVTDAMAGAHVDETDSAIAEVNRRLAAAERRQAQTIEAISIEIKRMSETVERRIKAIETRPIAEPAADAAPAIAFHEEMEKMSRALELRFEEIERREAAGFDRVTQELGRVAERMDDRVSSVEARSAQAIETIGEQIARMAERFNARQDTISRELGERITTSEERMTARISEMHQRADAVEQRETAPDLRPQFPPPPRFEAPSFDTVVRAAPLVSIPPHASQADDDLEIEFIGDDVPEETPPPPVAEPILSEAPAQTFPSFGDPSVPLAGAPLAEDDFEFDPYTDEPPPPKVETEAEGEGDDDWSAAPPPPMEAEAPPALEFDPFDDPPMASLAEPAPPPAPPKEDYLAAARRAALAQAAAPKKRGREPKAPKPPKAARGDKPVSGLRGPGRVILWGAAGVAAAALATGAVMLRTNADKQRASTARPTMGPPAAEAAPAPLAPPVSDAPLGSPSEEAMPDQPIPEDAATKQPTAATQQGATRTIARPIAAPSQNLEQAAARGDAIAQYDLAIQRIGAAQTEDGVALLRRAAAQNLAMAQYRLAKLYERGEGVPQDLRQSRQWTERAATNGNRRAMHDLGVFFARGEGAPLDEQQAFRWFRQAAELGVTDSQYNLGVLYQQGRGVTADPVEAMFWFNVASRSGDRDARARAAALEANLTQTQIEQARARAEAFRPRAASARANGEFGARPWAAPAA